MSSEHHKQCRLEKCVLVPELFQAGLCLFVDPGLGQTNGTLLLPLLEKSSLDDEYRVPHLSDGSFLVKIVISLTNSPHSW